MTLENLALSSNPSMPDEMTDDSQVLSQETGTEESTIVSQETVIDDADIIKLSRKDLQNEIERLRREDNDFAQVYNRDIGNKAKQRYQPEIDALRRTNEALQLVTRRNEYAGLTQEQVNERFSRDPKFAEDYARTIHAPEPTVTESTFNPQEIASAVGSVIGFAERILSPEQLEKLKSDIASDKYDKDESGNPYTVYSWREGLDRLQEDIAFLAKSNNTPVSTNGSTPITQPSAQQVRTDTALPDMTNTTGTTRRASLTMQQVREMSWEEQIRRWPNPGDMEKAIENGEVIVPGLNDR